jgi:hypothetical protein
MRHAIIFFPSEPSLVDERLYDRRKEYSGFLLWVLLGWGQGLGWLHIKEIGLYLHYKYIEPRQAVVRPCHVLRASRPKYLEKKQIPRMVWRPFLHGPELEWHGRKPENDYIVTKKK